MSKIVKNQSGGSYAVSDVGYTLSTGQEYTIPATDYLLWAASSDAVTGIGSGDLVINDGSSDLSISDGTDLIKGIFPNPVGIAGADGTQIGNTGDKLHVKDQDAITVLNAILAASGGSVASVFKYAEQAVTTRTEVDLTGVTYTVPTGKSFLISSFAASYDAQSKLYVRFEKQTGGTGSFDTLFRIVMMSGGQGESTLSYDLGNGLNIGSATDVFKVTIESSISKGTVWAAFGGYVF